MSKLSIKAYVMVTNALRAFKEEERGDVNIVSIVVLIGIAIGLAALFKNSITTMLNNLLGDIGRAASSVAQV